MQTSKRFMALALFGVLWIPCATASAAGDESERTPRVLRAAALDTDPVLDGNILSDAAWAGIPVGEGFVQTTPDEGEPSSQRTEVRVAFNADTLWIGVVCFDDDPSSIIVSDSRRDASLEETDSVRVILDTFRDRRNGFVFGTNPAGIEYDAQVAGEGNGGFSNNLDWDADWRVATHTGDHGWSAEFAIPFRTLRYSGGAEQTWGLNVQRNIRRRNEESYWAPLPRQFDLERLSLAGDLEAVQVPPQRNLKVIPYVLGSASEGGDLDDRETDTEAGVDVKYSITPSLTLDATINTDFAQVEADEQQINLDRFNLFFPEKRPFFLENAGQFSVGVEQEIELFFSRRIGLGNNGGVVPIEGGLRLSGKAGSSTNVGLLLMRADAVDGVVPETDYAVARLNHEFENRSSLGGIFVQRRGDSGDDNSTYAIDGQWGIGDNGQIRGFVAQTDTPGEEADEYAFRIGGGASSEDWDWGVNYTEVAEGFNPEVGFLSRDDYRKFDFRVLRRHRPKDFWGLHEVRPHISYRGFWGIDDDFQETGFLHVDNHWEWPSGFEIHTGVNFTREGVREGEAFEIADGVTVDAGTYDHEEAQLVLITNQGAPLSLTTRVVVGGFFGGDRLTVRPTVRYRVGETFTSDLSWSYNDIDLPGGAFETNLGRLRMTYSFTPKISLQALLQYNDRTDEVSTNLRFAWLQDANAGLFVVYNEIRETGGLAILDPQRALIVKYSRLFDVFR